jgi:hypothetical protein
MYNEQDVITGLQDYQLMARSHQEDTCPNLPREKLLPHVICDAIQ